MPLRPPPLRLAAAAAAVAVGLVGCTRVEPIIDAAPTTTTSTSTTSTPSTTTPVPAPAVTGGPGPRAAAAPTPLPGLGPGARGAEIQSLEQRLADLKYDPGKVDGVFDGTTGHAVMAFQKVHGLARTGRATPEVLSALSGATAPAAMLPGGGGDRVEIDLPRQVLFLWQGNSLARILPVSTGTGKRYCVDGSCARAVTPGGSFRVTRKILGLRVSRLGQLYNPLYFNGGIAIHGSNSVPGRPASHGCVRIPMSASRWFFDTVPPGTPVYVLGGERAPVPFNEQAPGDVAPAPVPPPVPPPVPYEPAPPPAPAPAPAPEPTPSPLPLLPL
ncbi:MAG: L,D-transpeptidase family protein [Actinomycetota bacterium]|nr:L,D-transpeptidase family protein [Actinomycetota bacterium]